MNTYDEILAAIWRAQTVDELNNIRQCAVAGNAMLNDTQAVLLLNALRTREDTICQLATI
jgi:hypothetical protein